MSKKAWGSVIEVKRDKSKFDTSPKTARANLSVGKLGSSN
jgi:hypothetical protein